jgi:hypothetical protein
MRKPCESIPVNILALHCLLLVTLVLPAFAQRQQAFAAKDYPAYLIHVTAELVAVVQRPALEPILSVAIALEKTQGWDGASGKQIAGILAKSPDAARYLAACKLLVRGDAGGLPKLFDGPAPSPYAVTTGACMAREHDFPLAADCLTAVSPDMPGLRVKAWLSIPKDQRATVI